MLKGFMAYLSDDTIVDYDGLRECPTPPATRTMHPIAHHHVADLVKTELHRMGIPIQDEQYCVKDWDEDHRTYSKMFGFLQLDTNVFNLDFSNRVAPWAPTVGFRNAHDGSLKLTVVAGKNTFVCSNMSIAGNYKVEAKHSRNLGMHLTHRVQALMSAAVRMPMLIRQREEFWAAQIIDNPQRVIIEAARRNIIPAAKILDVEQEVLQPSYQYGTVRSDSVYALSEAFTASALRPVSFRGAQSAMDKGPQLAQLMDDSCTSDL